MTQVNFYDKNQVDAKLDTKADKATTYTKTEVNDALASKADASTTYTKTEVDNALADKVDNTTLTNYATKTYVDGKRTIIPITSKDDVIEYLAPNKVSVGDELLFNVFGTSNNNRAVHGSLKCAIVESEATWYGYYSVDDGSGRHPTSGVMLMSSTTVSIYYLNTSHQSQSSSIPINDLANLFNVSYIKLG